MADEHSFEAHKQTAAYQEAKERLLAKLARWGGVVRKMPGVEEDPAKRRAELQRQAAGLAAKRDDHGIEANGQLAGAELPSTKLGTAPAAQMPLEITDDDIPF
jgi:hypothetical protein